MTRWQFLDLKIIDFYEFLKIQDWIWRERVKNHIGNTVIFAEHPLTISINQSRITYDLSFLKISEGKLAQMKISAVAVKRGGGIALHGPGILGCYVVAESKSVGDLFFLIERWIFTALADCGITACLYPCDGQITGFTEKELRKYRGFWHGTKKIGTEGLYISSRVSRFGVNLNVSAEPEIMALIHPCGITEYELGSLEIITGKSWETDTVKMALRKHIIILKES